MASGATQRIVVAGSYGGYAALSAFAPASLRLYAEQDANYNVTAMVDSDGNVVQRYLYDPYGNMTVLSATWTPQSDSFNTQVGFQGMWLDAASGLYHTAFRDYSVALGRWVEQDPSGYGDGGSLYEAFDANPTWSTDATGLSPDPTWRYDPELNGPLSAVQDPDLAHILADEAYNRSAYYWNAMLAAQHATYTPDYTDPLPEASMSGAAAEGAVQSMKRWLVWQRETIDFNCHANQVWWNLFHKWGEWEQQLRQSNAELKRWLQAGR